MVPPHPILDDAPVCERLGLRTDGCPFASPRGAPECHPSGSTSAEISSPSHRTMTLAGGESQGTRRAEKGDEEFDSFAVVHSAAGVDTAFTRCFDVLFEYAQTPGTRAGSLLSHKLLASI